MRSYPGNLLDLINKPSDAGRRQVGRCRISRMRVHSRSVGQRISFCGNRNGDSYDVWSVGPDGQDGTADDIGNWEIGQ